MRGLRFYALLTDVVRKVCFERAAIRYSIEEPFRGNGSPLGGRRKLFWKMRPASLNGTMRLPERYNQLSIRRKGRK